MLNRIAIAAVSGGLLTFPIAAYADAASEIATAGQHAGFAAAAPNLLQTHMHLHHALNCLVGPQDGDFDKTNMNPCAQKGKGAFPDESDELVQGDEWIATRFKERFDTVVVPGGTWCQHVNTSEKQPAILFVASDEPTLKALSFYQRHGKNDNGDTVRLT